MWFSSGFVYTFDSFKSETYLSVICYRHEVESPQEKAALCHFWYFLGRHQQNYFFLEVFGYSHSFPCCGYFSCGYREFIFWIKGLVSCPVLFTPSCTAILQMANERCHLEAAAGAKGDEGRWVWGAAFLPEQGPTQMEGAVKGDEGKTKTLSQAIYLEE